MTLLGKVLVFVNLAFSLAVAFFISQSYAKRTDWARAYNDANKALTQANAQRDQYQKEAQDAVNQGNAKVAAVQGTLEKAIQEKTACQAKVNDLTNQIKTKDETIAKYGLSGTGQINEVKRLSDQALGLQKMLAGANKQLDDQAKEREDFRQRAVKAEIDNKSLIARNNELLGVVEEKEKDIIRLKNLPGAGGAMTSQAALTANPPPGDVSGRVKQYDPTSGLLTITIGSDAGILKGHTLQVYRLEPNGQYVGVMRIMEVRPTEAVGKMINKPRAPVQVNDKVASKIS